MIAAGLTNNPHVEYEPRLESVKIIIAVAEKKFTKIQLFKFITAKNLSGETVISYAAKLDTTILLITICDIISNNFTSK